MRHTSLIVASISALLVFAASMSVQGLSQAVPDAPQPQKKPAAKQQAPPDAASQNPKPPDTKDENAFPEAVSQEAAKAAAQSHPTAQDNPFPEDVSRDAAKAAASDPAPAPAAPSDLPPGVSSSQSSSSLSDAENQVADPARARRDAEVGGFYLKSGDYQGALLRYKDATTADPTNVEAIFGLAETQRLLKKNADAARNYQLYLDIVPNGSKAKQALKALKTLAPVLQTEQ